MYEAYDVKTYLLHEIFMKLSLISIWNIGACEHAIIISGIIILCGITCNQLFVKRQARKSVAEKVRIIFLYIEKIFVVNN